MAHWRTRTGLVTLKALLHKLCLLIAKFRPYWVTILDAPDIALIDALLVKCEEIQEQVPTYEPIP
jgi:hypothetical protein